MNSLERAVYQNFCGRETDRLDLQVPRNASRTYLMQIFESDGITPQPLSGATGYMKLSYESARPALVFPITNFAGSSGSFNFEVAPSDATGLGIDCTQAVYDILVTRVGDTAPKFAKGGLVTLYKGVTP